MMLNYKILTQLDNFETCLCEIFNWNFRLLGIECVSIDIVNVSKSARIGNFKFYEMSMDTNKQNE